ERFSPEQVAQRPRYAYIPFGGGPRQCIGNMFSLMEAQIILAVLFRRLRFRAVPGQSITPRALGTIQPRRGVMMSLSKV
ncbi:MAG: cytochrome P450, partial [Nannocystaceae bacterium]